METDIEQGASPAATATVSPPAVVLEAALFAILKKKAEAGEGAFAKHIQAVALAYGTEATAISAAYEAAVAAEKAKVEAEARAKRIGEKRTKVDAWSKSNIDTFTVPKSVIVLMEKALAFAKTISDEDSQVTLVPTFGLNERGEPTVMLSSTGLAAAGAPRASTSSAGNGTHSEKSRISPWLAYEKGRTMGDTFVLSRKGPGSFRDETKGQDIPSKGMTKWIRSYYPDSHTAGVLKEYGQL